MAIKNIMEDIVNNLVVQLIKNDKELSEAQTNRDDIIAYVLNRVTPRYVTSERGILHGILDSKYDTQEKTDLLLLIYEAVNVIKSRRLTEQLEEEEDKSELVTRFPHIIGEVYEETTFSIIPDISIAIMYNDSSLEMINSDWKNPYVTHKATKGYYHFWPEYSKQYVGENLKASFKLIFKHPDFYDKTVDVEVNTTHTKEIGESLLVPIVLMKAIKEFKVNSD